jgi:hypothetical protein
MTVVVKVYRDLFPRFRLTDPYIFLKVFHRSRTSVSSDASASFHPSASTDSISAASCLAF